MDVLERMKDAAEDLATHVTTDAVMQSFCSDNTSVLTMLALNCYAVVPFFACQQLHHACFIFFQKIWKAWVMHSPPHGYPIESDAHMVGRILFLHM